MRNFANHKRMGMKQILFFSFLFIMIACKPDSSYNVNETKGDKAENTQASIKNVRKGEKANRNKDNLPMPCELLSVNELTRIFDISKDAVSIKDATNPSAGHTASCFFRWDAGAFDNQGILIQVMKNPVPDDFPMWASSYVESKITNGEQTFVSESVNYKYKRFDGFGDAGSYSSELGKYIWRTGEDYVFMVAFKVDNIDSVQQMEYARALATMIMSHI